MFVPVAVQFSSPIHHSNAGEKVEEFGGMSSDRVSVSSCRGLLQGRSHHTDGVEPVPSSVSLHAMTDDMNLCQVILLQRGFDCLYVTSTIL
jgi:hypothetical protein